MVEDIAIILYVVQSWLLFLEYLNGDFDQRIWHRINTVHHDNICLANKNILCDQVCQWLVTGRRFSPSTPVSVNSKTDRHDITEILLKVVLNIITQPTMKGGFVP
jgi:hypothetical protein